MKKYFLVEMDDQRARAAGIRRALGAYKVGKVIAMTEVMFEARDGSEIHSDTELLDMPQQTVSAYVDRKAQEE